MDVILVIILLSLGLYFIFNSVRRSANYPPGPRLLPIVGNLPELKKLSKELRGQHHALIELAKQCKTNVLGLKLGNQPVVVVFSFPVVKAVLTREEYDGRPDSFFIKLRSMGTRKGVTCTDGDLWRIQRNFVVRHLHSLGFGKQSMENKIKEELSEVLDKIKEHDSDIQIGRFIAPAVINVLWSLIAGSRISRGDPRLEKILDLLSARTKAFDMSGGVLSQYPWLRFVAPEQTGYNLITNLNLQFRQLFMDVINEHHENWTEARDDDLIYSFISEMKAANEHSTTFTDDQLIMVCLDLFIAGSQTTGNTLDFAFLMMILHPDIQSKVQAHLDDAFNPTHVYDYADRIKVPYIEAVLLEVQRYCLVTPVTGPRRLLRDTVLEGYNIPKETTVLINVYSVHMDSEYWGDPEVFRPERFLDSNGCLVAHDRLIAFGLGRRRCLGEVLARSCLFLFFVEILSKYTVCSAPGTMKPTGIPMPGLTLSPEKYMARFIKRR